MSKSVETTNVFKENGDLWYEITLPNALSGLRHELHVAHCMLWFRSSAPHNHHISYAFLQLRFDGLLGFPGGVVDEDITCLESIINALQREVKEEINFCGDIEVDDYFYSLYNKTDKFVSHFFAKEITLSEAENLEKNHMKARDFPNESLGIFRIPIGTSYLSRTNYLKVFNKNFMKQKFSGNVRKQIIDVCERYNLMSSTDLEYVKSQL